MKQPDCCSGSTPYFIRHRYCAMSNIWSKTFKRCSVLTLDATFWWFDFDRAAFDLQILIRTDEMKHTGDYSRHDIFCEVESVLHIACRTADRRRTFLLFKLNSSQGTRCRRVCGSGLNLEPGGVQVEALLVFVCFFAYKYCQRALGLTLYGMRPPKNKGNNWWDDLDSVS